MICIYAVLRKMRCTPSGGTFPVNNPCTAIRSAIADSFLYAIIMSIRSYVPVIPRMPEHFTRSCHPQNARTPYSFLSSAECQNTLLVPVIPRMPEHPTRSCHSQDAGTSYSFLSSARFSTASSPAACLLQPSAARLSASAE